LAARKTGADFLSHYPKVILTTINSYNELDEPTEIELHACRRADTGRGTPQTLQARMMYPSHDRFRRGGFTLVELLVVVFIIGLVLSITAAATMRVLGRQKSSDTEILITILSRSLNRHWLAVVEQAKKETVPPSVLNLAGGDARRAQVIWIKLRLKQEFPMTFAEVVNPGNDPNNPGGRFLGPLRGYLRTLIDYGLPLDPTDPTGNTPLVDRGTPQQACEMSCCLLMALQRNRRGINFDADSLPSGAVIAASYQVATPPGGVAQVQQIVDAWQNPLGFFRWPTGNVDLNPTATGTPGFNDPMDPEGLLCQSGWTGGITPSSQFLNFVLICHAMPVNGDGTPTSYRLNPAICSSGPNATYGLAGLRGFDGLVPVPMGVRNSPIVATLGSPTGATDTLLTVSPATLIVPSDLLVIDQEQMKVTNVTGTSVSVIRSYNGTSAVTHQGGALITVPASSGFIHSYNLLSIGARGDQ
jgi:prepilin-type N-terminal cleavage/methylation domain-containing protein